MIKLFYTFIILLSTSNLFAQNYYELIVDANQFYQNKNYKESAKKWGQAFDLQEGFAGDYYNAACTESLANNKDKAIIYLEKAVKKGWSDIGWLKKDSDLSALHASEEWTNLLENIPNLQAIRLESLNIELKNRLENLRKQDQVIRLLLPDAEKRFERESYEYRWFRSTLMPRNDSIVLDEIINIIDKDGWVGINDVGELANQTLWLVIQHAPLKEQKEYLPLLKKSVEKGESKGSYLAFLQDRILMREGLDQIYGTQSLWDNKLKKNVIYKIKNPEKVNELRKRVGLDSIEAYAKVNGFIYDQNK